MIWLIFIIPAMAAASFAFGLSIGTVLGMLIKLIMGVESR